MELVVSGPQTREGKVFPSTSMTEVLLSKLTQTQMGSHRSLHLKAVDEMRNYEMNRAVDFADSEMAAPFGLSRKETKTVKIEDSSQVQSNSWTR